MLDPRFLERMSPLLRQAFNGGDRLIADRGNRKLAGADRCVAKMNGTRPALSHAASILRSDQLQVVPQHPKQRGGWIYL
ncbi:hypothetical protein VDG1235_2157 [Verrucomicrobiia bacterium DG1235]|nr:hypothetical protein VDG1235_2157 [Verrucomicrobiae bacterium DG1235]